MPNTKTYLVTGGAGFIGSWYVLQTRGIYTAAPKAKVVTLDKLTYAGNRDNLAKIANDSDHIFVQGDIGNTELVAYLLREHKPDAVINFAAESHVDRSIHDPDAFVQTNVMGTCALLRTVLAHWQNLEEPAKKAFRFLHVSTDEVFGSLGPNDPPFTEKTPYAPNSPYSASKASSDHLVRAFHETYGLPTLITNCSNNYGPRQFPEKLIPLVIVNALARKPLPLYGKGTNIRDWLHVEDHCLGIECVLEKGRVGETYAIGGNSELTNRQVMEAICTILDTVSPSSAGPYSNLITHVTDRLGHDARYAIDCSKISYELGWTPTHSFNSGLQSTITWYLENTEWVERVQSGAYRQWIQTNYHSR